MQYISDISRRLSIVYVWGLLVFSFMESIILNIVYGFSFFLIHKFYKTGQQIMHFVLDHFIFLGSIDKGGYLVVSLWRVSFNSWTLFRCFFWPLNCAGQDLYIIPCFGHEECFIWRFLVLALLKSTNLTTIYFF